MYYNDYEDYMRSVLGYSDMGNNTYGCNCMVNYNNNMPVEQMYPEIYRVINPMVCKMCDSNTQPVTEYLIEQMTNNIYDNVVNRTEVKNLINLNIEVRQTDDANNTANSNSSSNKRSTSQTDSKSSTIVQQSENRSAQPRRNQLLQDLIRILIINRLLQSGRPNRPSYRPGPGGPGMPGPGPRPPMPRMNYNYMMDDYDTYM